MTHTRWLADLELSRTLYIEDPEDSGATDCLGGPGEAAISTDENGLSAQLYRCLLDKPLVLLLHY